MRNNHFDKLLFYFNASKSDELDYTARFSYMDKDIREFVIDDYQQYTTPDSNCNIDFYLRLKPKDYVSKIKESEKKMLATIKIRKQL